AHALSKLRRAGSAAATGLRFVRLVPLVLRQSARRPVRLRGVAAARAVEGGDVLERDEDVAVELDVGDVVDVAVGRPYSVLVLAAEQGYFDLLALVLARVVLHEGQSNRRTRPSSIAIVATAPFSIGALLRRNSDRSMPSACASRALSAAPCATTRIAPA